MSMLKRRIVFTLIAAIGLTLAGCSCGQMKKESAMSGPYRHVVLFKFKDGTSQQQIDDLNKAFAALPDKLDFITGFEWGTNLSPEHLNEGFTHCYIVSFADAEGIKKYLPSDAHQAFVKMLKPHLDKVLVIDFIARDH